MSDYTHPNRYYHLAENFNVYLQAKKQLHPLYVFEMFQIYSKYILNTLGMPYYIYRIWWYELVEDFDVYVVAKNTLHHSHYTLHNYILKNPSIWLAGNWITRNCQIWDQWWYINNNISFHFRLLPRKTNEKIFQNKKKKTKKKLFWDHFGHFLPCANLGKNEFSWKKKLCQLLNIQIIYHRAENQKKTNGPFLRKMLNWKTDRRTVIQG